MQGKASDGLEVLLASVAMDTKINIVFDDYVWSTSKEGVDFQYPMVIWMTAGALACRSLDPECGNAADVDTSKTSDSAADEEQFNAHALQWKAGGRPLILSDSTTDSTENTETDPEGLLDEKKASPKK